MQQQPASRIPQSTYHSTHSTTHSGRESLSSSSPAPAPSAVLPAGSPFQTRQTTNYTHSTATTTTSDMSTLSERRLNQRNKDERIRKKIEDDLAKKRGGVPSSRRGGYQSGTPSRTGGTAGSSSRSKSKQAAGTVSALRPTPALTVPQHISVADASQLCAAKRTDCVLVVDDEEHLCGIFTAKDLAFRVVGEGLDPRSTTVQSIMTPNPMVTRDTTSATDALQTMVTRHFRHLPVCNEDGDVVGLLDITKVFQESLEKLERAYGSSQKLYAALEGVQSEWGANSGSGFSGANGLMNYVEALREKMSCPDLGSILDARTRAVTVTPRTSVKEAAVLMREHRTTAVCVEENGKLAGIFTSKDVVLRVIAAGLGATSTSVIRVMTPHPDTGTPALSIQQALRKMNDGRFLNLPVVEEDGTLVGCVDVLKLTYATLEQISAIGAEQGMGGDAAGGPLWSRFFSSFAGNATDGDNESVVSDSQAPTSSVAPGTPSAMPKHLRQDSAYAGSPSEIHPNDSASALGADDDDTSELVQPRSGKGKKGGRSAESAVDSANNAALAPDDGTYLFKFLSPSGTTHRFVARYDNHPNVREIIAGKLASDPFFLFQNKQDGSPPPGAGEMDPNDFLINYTDDDGDLVLLSTDHDLEDSVKTARSQGRDRVLLIIKGGKGWENAIQATAEQQQAERKKALKAVQEETHADQSFAEVVPPKPPTSKKAKSSTSSDDELVLGFLQKDMVLPAAIAFLGVAVIGVFALSKSSNK